LAFNRRLAVVVVGAPATPVTLPRVRFCVSAAHSHADLADALAHISDIADELALKFKLAPPNRLCPGSLEVMEKKEAKERVKRVALAEKSRPAALAAAASLAQGGNTARFAPLHSRGETLGDDLGSTPADPYAATGMTEREPREYTVTLSSQDVLALTNDPVMKEACASTIEKLGLGSCSPRGFYGTFPPHVEVERTIAEFLGCQEAVLYSFGACTVSSVIPAMGHRSDVAVVDRGVGHGILAGLRLAKMDVRWYNHCDAEDCARVFANLEAEDGVTSARLARPGRRRWLITEACFLGTGRLAPLPELVALKETHHARLILDESCSFGAMGASGRGLTEHFGVDTGKVDVIVASLEGAGASVGGFCAGDTGVVAYQRLMGSGYVFSASLPPYLATAAAHAIKRVSADPGLVERAQISAAALRDAALSGRIPGFTTDADAGSPVVPLRLAAGGGAGDENALLADIAARARQRGVGVCVARINPLVPAQHRPPLALRAFASAAHTTAVLGAAFSVLAEEAAAVLPRHALGGMVGGSPVAAHRRILLDPGATLLKQKQLGLRASGSVVPPHSPTKAPGATIQLDGTIRLNHDNTTASPLASPDINSGVPNSVTGERIPSRKPGRPDLSRSASWSVFDAQGAAPTDAQTTETVEASVVGGSRLWSDQDNPQSLSVPLLVVLLYWRGGVCTLTLNVAPNNNELYN
jgi:serine palmitoyltransferase